jgi:hypothetical protein
MTDLLNPKMQATGIVDLAGMLIVKRVVDGFAMPIVGNNNLISGVAKLAVGGLLHGKGGRIGHIATGGIILDGADDLVGVALGMFGGKFGGGGSQQVANPGA